MSNCKRKRRQLFHECLETRRLLAADLGHNYLMPLDVNEDYVVSPADALIVINSINSDVDSDVDYLVDVNDDLVVSAMDALQIVNELNDSSADDVRTTTNRAEVSRENWLAGENGERVRVEFQSDGIETEFSIKLVGGNADTTYPILVTDISIGEMQTDSRGRGSFEFRDVDALPPEVDGLDPNLSITVGSLTLHELESSQHHSDEDDASDDSQDDASDDHGAEDPEEADDDDSQSDSDAREVELEAVFEKVAGVEREAEYEVEVEHGQTVRQFEAEIEHAEPNTQFVILVDSIEVGILVTDALGHAKLKLSTDPSESETLMPDDFPSIARGSTIAIGNIQAEWR